MTARQSPMVSEAMGPIVPTRHPDPESHDATQPAHLVIKRGHNGRYRFAFMMGLARLKGEVHVALGGDRLGENAAARAAVRRLAAILAQTAGTPPNA